MTEDEKIQEEMDGSPSHVTRKHIDIRFQLGPVKVVSPNGCQIPDVLDILLDRLRGFQRGEFACRENALAITKMEEARHWLWHRTVERQHRGVEGYNKP